MPPIRRKIIDVDCLSESSPYKPKVKEESDDDVEEVRVEVGVDEVESDVEPQDDYNGLSDSDESDFAQDVADASEDIGDIGDDDEEDIEETPPSSGGDQDKVEPLIKVDDILGKTKDSVRAEGQVTPPGVWETCLLHHGTKTPRHLKNTHFALRTHSLPSQILSEYVHACHGRV